MHFVTFLIFLTYCHFAFTTTLTVNYAGDDFSTTGGRNIGGELDLRGALNVINVTPDTYLLQFTLPSGSETISLNNILPILNLNNANTITLDGSNTGGSGTQITINGNTRRVFFARQGNIAIENFTIQNGRAAGGNGGTGGGGGGMGAGGGLFIHQATVSVANVSFTGCSALGGTGGASSTSRGGGGGMGGNGGAASSGAGGAGGGGIGGIGGAGSGAGGGGGGGGLGPGGNGSVSGVPGASGGGFGDGTGGAGGVGGGAGGATAGGGGGGSAGGGGGGGGVNGSAAVSVNGGVGGWGGGGGGVRSGSSSAVAGAGGFGGGGGSFTDGVPAVAGVAGDGGIGGGGGASRATAGGVNKAGAGGFGGGGGGSSAGTAKAGGVGGGTGGINAANVGGGGGGAGLGGAIFVYQGGSLTLQGGVTTSGSTVTAGAGAATGGTTGAAAATDLCLVSLGVGNTLQLSPTAISDTLTISSVIGDDSVSTLPGGTYTAGTGVGAAINKTGAGTAVLGGTNTYAGATSIGGGNLKISSPSNLGSTSGITFSSAGLLETSANMSLSTAMTLSTGGGGINVDPSVTTTLTTVFGVGSSNDFYKAGTGTLIWSSASNANFTGQVQLAGGTLQISSLAPLGSAAGITFTNNGNLDPTTSLTFSIPFTFSTGGGTLTSDLGETMTLNGNNSGSGSLTKAGAGALILNGVSSYTGGTTVSAGTLQGDTDSLQGNIVNNASLIFDQASDGTYSGTLTGIGTFEKTNAGVLTLSGSTTQTSYAVNAGTVLVNGTSTGNFTVDAAAVLGGIGTIIGDVFVSGTMAPGVGIGTITVMGNHTQLTGSTLEIEVSPTMADRLDVTGSFTTQPDVTLQILTEAGIYPPGTTYTIVNAAGGIIGPHFTVVATPPFPWIVTYNLTNIQISLAQGGIFGSFFARGANAEKVAQCLNNIIPPVGSDFRLIRGLVFLETQEQREQSLDQMQPSLFKGITLSNQQNAFSVRKAIMRRLFERVAGYCADFCNSYDIWVDGFGDFGKQTQVTNQIGYKTYTGGGTIGIDIRPLNEMILGMGATYTYTDIDWHQHRGKGRVNNVYGSIYSGWLSQYLFADAILMGSWMGAHASRNVDILYLHRSASHSNQGFQAESYVDFGVNLDFTRISLYPFVSGDYLYSHEGAYTETGAQSLNLHVKETNAQMARFETGLRASHCSMCTQNSLSLDLKASWIREFRFEGAHNTSTFSEVCCCTFTTQGYFPDRNLLGISAQIRGYFLNDVLSLSVGYDGELGSKSYDQAVDLHAEFKF